MVVVMAVVVTILVFVTFAVLSMVVGMTIFGFVPIAVLGVVVTVLIFNPIAILSVSMTIFGFITIAILSMVVVMTALAFVTVAVLSMVVVMTALAFVFSAILSVTVLIFNPIFTLAVVVTVLGLITIAVLSVVVTVMDFITIAALAVVVPVGFHYFRVPIGAMFMPIGTVDSAQHVGQPDYYHAQYQQGSGAGYGPSESGPETFLSDGVLRRRGPSSQPYQQEHIEGKSDFQGQDPDIQAAISACAQVDHRHECPGYYQDDYCNSDDSAKLLPDSPRGILPDAGLSKCGLKYEPEEDAAAHPSHRSHVVDPLDTDQQPIRNWYQGFPS